VFNYQQYGLIEELPSGVGVNVGWLNYSHQAIEPAHLAKRGLPTHEQQFIAFVKAAPFPETVREDKWHQPWSEPVRLKQGPGFPAFEQQFLALVKGAPFPETVTYDRWNFPRSEPVRLKGLHASQQQALAFVPVVVTTAAPSFGYYVPFTDPVRQKIGLSASQNPYFFWNTSTSPETISYDRFAFPWSEPVRVKSGLSASAQQFLALVEAAPFTETVTEDRWHQPWSEPVRFKQGLAAHQQQFLALVKGSPFPETVSEDRWHQPWSEPVRLKNGLAAYEQQFLAYVEAAPFPETTSVDRWFQPWSEPVRTKPRAPQFQDFFYGSWSPITTIVPSFGYYNWLSEPVRQKFFLTALQQAQFQNPNVKFPETVSFDRWGYPWSEPVRTRNFPTSEQQFSAWDPNVRFPETVSFDRWAYPWVEPPKKPWIHASQQQFLAFQGVPIAASYTAQMRATEQGDLSTMALSGQADLIARIGFVSIVSKPPP
jgi:hypothetical protein